jgi:uncharacterized membrane protein YedE/YeeE
MKFSIGLVAGALFGLGLVMAQMTDPRRIIGFLDLFGNWDPRLAFVMVGAIAVHAPCVILLKRHGKPFLANRLSFPGESRIDRKLVFGAALFGVGWGLAGYCPGPAIVAASRNGTAAILTLSMLAGMWIFDRLIDRRMKRSLPPIDSAGSRIAPLLRGGSLNGGAHSI